MKVIIADDSAVVRAILEQNLRNYPDIEVIASVSNGKRMLQAVKAECPDVILADSDMPETEGIKTLVSLAMEFHVPMVILKTGEKVEKVEKHPVFVSFIDKPSLNDYSDLFFGNLLAAIKDVVSKSPKERKVSEKSEVDAENAAPGIRILCIGASTGGPSAVADVLRGLGNDFSLPVLYTQHIEVGADHNMADWFCSVCPNIKVTLAEDGEEAKKGHVYMAPADTHLVIDYVRSNGNPVLKLSREAPERFLRPAVNMLFRSAARYYGRGCLGLLLTGMGMDGAEGCKSICDRGGWTIVEDKSTCTVFGMPAAAIEAGGAKEILPRGEIPGRILKLVGKNGSY